MPAYCGSFVATFNGFFIHFQRLANAVSISGPLPTPDHKKNWQKTLDTTPWIRSMLDATSD